jgi:hypothetical protein
VDRVGEYLLVYREREVRESEELIREAALSAESVDALEGLEGRRLVGHPIALVIGVDGDTGLIFVHGLPRPFSTIAARLHADGELNEQALRRLMGFTHHLEEASIQGLKRGMRVRLQGDIVLEVLDVGRDFIECCADIYAVSNVDHVFIVLKRLALTKFYEKAVRRGLIICPWAGKGGAGKFKPSEPKQYMKFLRTLSGSGERALEKLRAGLDRLVRNVEGLIDPMLVERGGGEKELRDAVLNVVANYYDRSTVLSDVRAELLRRPFTREFHDFTAHLIFTVIGMIAVTGKPPRALNRLELEDHTVSFTGIVVSPGDFVGEVKARLAWKSVVSAVKSGAGLETIWGDLLHVAEFKRRSVLVYIDGMMSLDHREHGSAYLTARGLLGVLTAMNSTPLFAPPARGDAEGRTPF